MKVKHAEQLAVQLQEHLDYRVLRRTDTSPTAPALEGPTVLRRPFEQDGAPVTALTVLLDSARSQEAVQAELAWLKETVFGGKSVALEFEEFDAKTRYLGREGKKERVRT